MTIYKLLWVMIICVEICLIYCVLDYYGVIDFFYEIFSPSYDRRKKKDKNGKK